MIRQRLRKFVGMHPVLAVNLGSVLCLVAAPAGMFALAYLLFEVLHVRDETIAGLAFFAWAVLCWLGIVAWSMGVGLVLGRAGITSTNVLGGLKYAPLVVAALVLVGATIVWFILSLSSPYAGYPFDWFSFLLASLMGGVLVMAAQAVGWGLAALVSRWKLRGGRWEVTRPAAVVVARMSWGLRHPVAAISVLASAVFVVYSQVLILVSLFAWRSTGAVFARVALYAAWVPMLAAFVHALVLVWRRRGFGRSGRPVLTGAAALVPCCIAGAAVMGLLWWSGVIALKPQWSPYLWCSLAAALATAASTAAGWGVAEVIVRRRMRRGTWEVTLPADGENAGAATEAAEEPEP